MFTITKIFVNSQKPETAQVIINKKMDSEAYSYNRI